MFGEKLQNRTGADNYSSLSIDLAKAYASKDGFAVAARVIKNKYGPPLGTAAFGISYDSGITEDVPEQNRYSILV